MLFNLIFHRERENTQPRLIKAFQRSLREPYIIHQRIICYTVIVLILNSKEEASSLKFFA